MRITSLLAVAALAAVVLPEVRRRSRKRDLGGAVVAITGASRGLGLVLAEEFAERGSTLAICARDGEKLEAARERIAARGAEVLALPTDVRDREAVRRFVDETTRRFGRIDVLVNNAGILTMGPLETLDEQDFVDAMDTMFWGPLHGVLAVLPQMRDRGSGTIVNISSIGGKVGSPHLLPYSAAKFALAGLSEGLHAELAGKGINVLTVIPGFMRTGSYLNARFTGNHEAEFNWFSLAGNLPFTSIDARRAARQIVDAIAAGESELIITPQARAAALLFGAFPGFTTRLVALGARLLPRAPGTPAAKVEETGWDSRSALSDSFLTAMGRRAADDLQQAS